MISSMLTDDHAASYRTSPYTLAADQQRNELTHDQAVELRELADLDVANVFRV